MADDTSVTTPDTGDSSQYQGVSNPPNGGNVSTVDTPSNEMQGGTPAPQSQPAPSQGQSASTPSDDGTGGPQQPGQAPQGSQGPQGPQQGQKAPQQPKTPSDDGTGGTGGTGGSGVHPSVARAGILSQVAQALAGGPRMTHSIDPATGVMKETPVALSGRQIGMAIALEALSGSITGLAQQGPNATAKAAAAAFQQQEQKQQQMKQEAQQQATSDYARHAQILETNMNTRINAMNLRQKDLDTNMAYDKQYADQAEDMIKNHPERNPRVLTEAELHKANVTQQNAIPYKTVESLDKDGKPVKNAYGNPVYEHLWLVYDPVGKSTGGFTKEKQDFAASVGEPGFDNDLIGSSPINVSISANRNARIDTLMAAKNSSDTFFDGLNKANGTPSYDLKETPISDPRVSAAIDKAASTYTNVPKALIQAVAHQEDPALNPSAISHAGAQGIMQLMPSTAADFKVTDPTNVEANVDAGTHYLSQLLYANKGNIPLALASYDAGPGNVKDGKIPNFPETQDYVKRITSAIGLGDQKGTVDPSKQIESPDFIKAVKEDPGLKNAWVKFQSYLAHAEGPNGQLSYGTAIKAMSDPKTGDAPAAAKMLNYLGQGGDGLAAINKYDLHEHLAITQREAEDKAKISEDEALTKAKNTRALNQESIDAMNNILKEPPNWNPDTVTGDESRNQLKSKLQSAGVNVDHTFDTLYAIGHYDLNPKTTEPPKVYNNGKQFEMDSQTAMDYIRKFINPNYNDGDYDGIHSARKALYDPKSPSGIAMQASGTALQHANMLDKAIDALSNGNIAPLAHLANEFGLATGGTPQAIYNAIAPKVADEVSKAAMAGGTPYQGQIDEGRKTLNDGLSNGQGHAVLQAYRGLINERMKSLDGISMQTAREHLKIPPDVTAEFQRHGFDTPWHPGSGQQQGANQNQQPQAPVYSKHTADGKLGLNKATNAWEPIASQAK